jgi:hypothetical protein
MVRIKNTGLIFFHIDSGPVVDIGALLRGVVGLHEARRILALSGLTGEQYPMDVDALQVLLAVPSDWTPLAEVAATCQVAVTVLEDFARKGLAISDDGDASLTELRRRHTLGQRQASAGQPGRGLRGQQDGDPLAVASEIAGLPAETRKSSRNQSRAEGMLVPAIAATKRSGCPIGLATYIALSP